jgi:hypothetical protein
MLQSSIVFLAQYNSARFFVQHITHDVCGMAVGKGLESTLNALL